MKTMTRMAMMVAVMVLAVTSVGQAQGGGGGGGRGGNRVMAVLKDSMKVSEAILAKADSIQKAGNAAMAPLMEAARGGDADARTKMNEMRTKQTAEIKALLSAEQQAQFDKIMAAFPQGRRGGGPAPR
jgi:dienelactone hydrolase